MVLTDYHKEAPSLGRVAPFEWKIAANLPRPTTTFTTHYSVLYPRTTSPRTSTLSHPRSLYKQSRWRPFQLFTMSSYLSNILTNTTSKYNTLRRNLLSDEVDGDTEDDSHLCRALRAYYTEQGKAFPQWLPPDPKQRAASAQTTTSSFTSSLRQQQQQPQQQHLGGAAAPTGGRGGLSDLWDTPGQRAVSPQPMSLRRQAADRSGSFQGRVQAGDSLAAPRPLPSQRAGSYQGSVSQYQGTDPSPPSSSGGTAQGRLKARLWGAGRAGSPAPGAAGSGSGRFARQ